MDVAFIVLNWNSLDLVSNCLSGLMRHEAEAMVYLVDNGSDDGSAEVLAKRFPTVTLVRSPRNLGFGEGNNLGAERALQDGCDAVFLLNNDTIVDEPFLAPLVSVAMDDAFNTGIIGPVVVEGNDPTTIQSAGGHIKTWLGTFPYRLRGERYIRSERVDEVDYVLGAAMLIRGDVIKEIGLFDPEYYPAYVEEADLCYRARAAGFRCLVHHGTRVRHLGGRSSGGTENAFRRMMHHRWLFALKHFGPLRFATTSLFITARVLVKKVLGL